MSSSRRSKRIIGSGGEPDEIAVLVRDQAVSIPVIASSGAGCAQHFHEVFTETQTESALAAGIFHREEVPFFDVKRLSQGQG